MLNFHFPPQNQNHSHKRYLQRNKKHRSKKEQERNIPDDTGLVVNDLDIALFAATSHKIIDNCSIDKAEEESESDDESNSRVEVAEFTSPNPLNIDYSSSDEDNLNSSDEDSALTHPKKEDTSIRSYEKSTEAVEGDSNHSTNIDNLSKKTQDSAEIRIDDDSYGNDDELKSLRDDESICSVNLENDGYLKSSNHKENIYNTQSLISQLAPKTENEINAYSQFTSEDEKAILSKMVNFQIKENEEKILREFESTFEGSKEEFCNLTTKTFSKNPKQHSIQLAGHVKSHLILEKTIVIESAGNAPPLDEGTLLFIIAQPNHEINLKLTPSKLSSRHNKSTLILLGKVFEAFGPVKKPFYTIRLPQSFEGAEKQSTQGSQVKKSDTTELKNGIDDNDENCICVKTGCDNEQQSKDFIQTNNTNKQNKQEEIFYQNESEDSTDKSKQKTPVNKQFSERDLKKVKKQSSALESSKDVKNLSMETNIPVDPWSHDGSYTKLLKHQPNEPVYFLEKISNKIDTELVMKMSGRGCDASNIYDEELGGDDAVDFSDDEKERLSKKKGKKPFVESKIREKFQQHSIQQHQRKFQSNQQRHLNRSKNFLNLNVNNPPFPSNVGQGSNCLPPMQTNSFHNIGYGRGMQNNQQAHHQSMGNFAHHLYPHPYPNNAQFHNAFSAQYHCSAPMQTSPTLQVDPIQVTQWAPSPPQFHYPPPYPLPPPPPPST